MKPELIFIFRHGPNTPDGFLTVDGLRMIEELGLRLREKYELSPRNSVILHSGELRALKTAQAMLPDIDEYADRALFSNSQICDVNAAIDVIKTYGETTENLIVITHLEMAALLPSAFGSQVFEVVNFPSQEVQHGQGWIIDCQKQTCESVRL